MEETLKLRLEHFAKWCCDYTEHIDSFYDGTIEKMFIRNKEETINKIGDMLQEILDTDLNDLENN